MGNVYDRDGRRVGSVNAWSGVYDVSGRKVGSMDIYSNRVYDASGRCVGTSDWHGNVHDASGRYLCQVAFFGSSVKDARGDVIGSVGVAGAPEPPPDMQWRGGAAFAVPESAGRATHPRRRGPGVPLRPFAEAAGGAGGPRASCF